MFTAGQGRFGVADAEIDDATSLLDEGCERHLEFERGRHIPRIDLTRVLIDTHMPIVEKVRYRIPVNAGTTDFIVPLFRYDACDMGAVLFLSVVIGSLRFFRFGVEELKVVDGFQRMRREEIDVRAIDIKIFVVVFQTSIGNADRYRRQAVNSLPHEWCPDDFQAPIVAVGVVDVPRIEQLIIRIKLCLSATIDVIALCAGDIGRPEKCVQDRIKIFFVSIFVPELITED